MSIKNFSPLIFSIFLSNFQKMIFSDKYFLFCLLTCVLILLLSSLYVDSESNGNIGLVENLEQTSNGYTFNLLKSDGTVIHCFTSLSVSNGNIISIDNCRSGDNIIFVNSLIVLC